MLTARDDILRRTARYSWWPPLAFVVVSLLLLAAVPLVVGSRTRRMRRTITEVIEPARRLVDDEEAALAAQMYALGEIAQGEAGDGVTRFRRALARRHATERELDRLTRALDPEARSRLGELRALAASWQSSVEPLVAATASSLPGARPRPPRDTASAGVLASAQRLDDAIERVAAAERDRIREVERLDVQLPAVLVPLALVASAVVFWLGRMLVMLVHESEDNRHALAAAMDTKAALMRGVTHDLKNPLGAAAGHASNLQDGVAGPLSPMQQEMVGHIRRLVGSSLATVSDLLELSQAETGALSIRESPTDVAQLVRDCAAEYLASARMARLRLDIDVPETLPIVVTDAGRVRQVIGNLVTNAIKYTPAGGALRLHAAVATGAPATLPRSSWLAIAVADTGPGIPPEHHRQVFEEFFRLPATHNGASGNGVGLAISLRIARLLGGDLTLASERGAGSTFTLWLPLRDGPSQ